MNSDTVSIILAKDNAADIMPVRDTPDLSDFIELGVLISDSLLQKKQRGSIGAQEQSHGGAA